MRLKGKVVLITGAGSGIGRATATLFAEEGAKIVVVDCNPEAGNETVKFIVDKGGEAIFVQTDVSKAADVENAIKLTIQKYEKIDILLNNAGIVDLRGTVTSTKEEDWDRVIDVNLKGAFLCAKYVIPQMIRNGGGVIINTGSTVGLVGYRNFSAYCASKGGLIVLTKAMALDYAPNNIRINCICPGVISTPKAMRDIKDMEAVIQSNPLGRIGKPEEVGYAALYLASDESRFVTGAILAVDGGFTAQ